MIKELIKLANHLDSNGLVREADCLDRVMKKIINKSAGSMSDEYIVQNPNEAISITTDDGSTHTIKMHSVDTGWYGDSAQGGLEYSINDQIHEWEFHSGYYADGAIINIIENIEGINNDMDESTEIEDQIKAFLEKQITRNPNYKEEPE